MLEVARAAVLKANLSSTTADGSLPYTPEIRVGGNGVSGPSFIDNAEYRSYIYREFDARCVDMESAAAAQVASQNGVPFLFFRSLSNLAGADVDENTFNAFIALAADNAFAVTFAVIQALYQEPGNTSTATPSAPTSASSSAVSLYSLLIPALVCWGFLFNNSG
jgi:adenosylhomocysteine nucleosidase